jgi:hypothetical protein
MRKHRILALGYFLAALATVLQAQTAGSSPSYPPPIPPLVARVPERAQWAVTLNYPGDSPTPAVKDPAVKPKHRLHQVVSTKTLDLKRDVELFDDGTTETYWFVGGLILLPEANGKDVGMIDFAQANREYGEAGNPVESIGFAGVGWLQLKYYDTVAPVQNMPCYHYALRAKAPSAIRGAGDTSSDIEAWINVKTGYPVSYRSAGVTYDYTFGSAPETDLVLPPKYAQALKVHQQIEDRRKQLEKDLGQ